MTARPLVGLLFAILAGCGEPAPPIDFSGPTSEWTVYRAEVGGGGFSPLTQITPDNVRHLEVAWTYHTGFRPQGEFNNSTFQTTPIVVDGTLYLCAPNNRVIALDPETGEERWSFDPGVDTEKLYLLNCRGVSHWRDPESDPTESCWRRIFLGTLDARLFALDAETGEPCRDFGEYGSVDLSGGMGEIRPGEYGVTSPPVVVRNRVVTGAMVLDNLRIDAPSGVVRAFDARSGEQLWAWSPVPPGSDPISRDAEGRPIYRRGTANAWSALSADPELGLVYAPTGNTSPDFWGGQRDGLDYYSSSVVALDVETGAPAWRFQTVHHDIWDYDVSAQPTLFEFPTGEGETLPALAQGTKMGHLFFLDRRTGEAIFPVEERPVPQVGAVPGEVLSPTQPFPTLPPPLHPAELGPDDAFGFNFFERGQCREQIESLLSQGIFTPPSLQGSIIYPGAAGGINWGSVAIDPRRLLLVVNTLRIAVTARLIPREEFERLSAGSTPELGLQPQEGTPFAVQVLPLVSSLGTPCNPPPWGTLMGIDLRTGEILWDVTLGTIEDLAPWPLPYLLPETGAPNLGGPIATASGLTFIAATTDHYLRAFSTQTGEELWRGRLPTSAQATPMTYRIRPEGKQYVVVAAGGHFMFETPPGDALVAFALP